MLRSRFVSVVLIVAMALCIPVSTVSAADKPVSGPQVTTSAAPLSAAELARYGQAQAVAQEKGVLASEKGGADALTWTVIGVLTVGIVVAGLIVASRVD